MQKLARRRKPKGFWRDQENLQQFFTELASEQEFDPHVADNWRNVPHSQFLEKKASGISVMGIDKALKVAFPDMEGVEGLFLLF